MGQMIQLKPSDGVTIAAYRADPSGPPKGGVVVVQEVFGLNHHIRAECDRFAAEGYLAVAPAVQDRLAPGFSSDNYTEDMDRVRAMMKDFKQDLAMLDVAAAVKIAAEGGKVGIVGYCLGGRLCWLTAHEGLGVSAASGYYGGGIPTYLDLAPKIPIEMHFGDQDTGIPMDQVEQLRARYPDVPMYIYPAGHGFNCDERGSYDAASATTARARTLAFFAKHLA